MPTAFTPVITAAGLAAAVTASGAGLSLQLTHVALGAGKYNPTGSEVSLVDRRETRAISAGAAAGPTQLTIISTFTGYAGPEYDLGEVGFYAGDPDAGGILFAVASRAGLRYAIRNSSVDSYTAENVLSLSGVPSGSVIVIVDPAAGPTLALLAQYVRKAGDVMTGPLTLNANAAAALVAVPKQQLDTGLALKLNKAGDTMTGPLVLPGNAVAALQAVPLQQLSASIAALGTTSQSLSANGYQTFPGGLVVQWFTVPFTDVPSGAPGFAGFAVFPIEFPNACFLCMAGTEVFPGGNNNWHISVTGKSNSGITFQVQEWASVTNSGTAVFIAIGH